MAKDPTPAPAVAPLLAPGDVEDRRKTDQLLAKDRKRLSSFVKNLNKGVRFDDLDHDLKAWWADRY